MSAGFDDGEFDEEEEEEEEGEGKEGREAGDGEGDGDGDGDAREEEVAEEERDLNARIGPLLGKVTVFPLLTPLDKLASADSSSPPSKPLSTIASSSTRPLSSIISAITSSTSFSSPRHKVLRYSALLGSFSFSDRRSFIREWDARESSVRRVMAIIMKHGMRTGRDMPMIYTRIHVIRFDSSGIYWKSPQSALLTMLKGNLY